MGPTAASRQLSRARDCVMLGTSHRLTLFHRQKVVATNETTEHWYGGEGDKLASALHVLVDKEISKSRVGKSKNKNPAPTMVTPQCPARHLHGAEAGGLDG